MDEHLEEGALADLKKLLRREYTEKYGVSNWRWQQLRRRHGFGRWGRPEEGRCEMRFPEGLLPELPPERHYCGESVLVAADWHVPHHDERMAEALCKVGERESVDRLILCGDFLNEDVFFRGGNDKLPIMVSFKEELVSARRVLGALLEVFPNVTWLAGNHEQRLFRTSKGELDMEMLLHLVAGDGRLVDVDRVEVTDRDYVLLDHPDPDYRWRITHGVGGSVSSAAAAAVVKAETHGINVAQGHNHLVGWRQTRTGRHVGMDVGCMLRPEWVAYKALNTNTFPIWNQGFALIRDGKPSQFSRRWTDWGPYGLEL